MIPLRKVRSVSANRQGLREIRERMQELYIYDLYAFRSELKPLSAVLYPYETINCILVGLHNRKRKLLAVTYYRIITISASFGSPAEITQINREHIKNPQYTKRWFISSISFETEKGESYTFSMVSRRVLDLFVWAVNQPAPIRS
jgi:hypothetical protein